MNVYETIGDAYKELLSNVLFGEYVADKSGQVTKELRNCCFTITDPSKQLFEHPVRSSPAKYIAAELLWYLSKDRTVDFIGQYASLWHRMADEFGLVNSNYGYHIWFDFWNVDNEQIQSSQWAWCLRELSNNEASRRAVIYIGQPRHQQPGVRDFPCTGYLSFSIRDNRLYLNVHMRSNDIVYGLPSDFAFFAFVQSEFLKTYNKLTSKSVELGSYTHFVDSMHLYAKHFDVAQKFYRSTLTPRSYAIPQFSDCVVNTYGIVHETIQDLTGYVKSFERVPLLDTSSPIRNVEEQDLAIIDSTDPFVSFVKQHLCQ